VAAQTAEGQRRAILVALAKRAERMEAVKWAIDDYRAVMRAGAADRARREAVMAKARRA
jgi:hypothetical protein